MPTQSIDRAIMHGLAACLDGPVQRHKVSLAMRHVSAKCRRTAAANMLNHQLVELKQGEKGARGPAPVMVAITDAGRIEHARLSSDFAGGSNSIWGDA